jgi:hypothetical protein
LRQKPRISHLKAAFGLGLALVGGLVAAACARPAMPNPRDAAEAYARAVERGDADALHRMLTRESQRALGRDGTARLLTESKKELVAQAAAIRAPNTAVETIAAVRFDDGEQAVLELERGRFRVGAAAGLPAAARTPEQALVELRQALARRSYPALMRLLSKDAKSAIEDDLRSLVVGLEEADALDVKIEGDSAEVRVPGGHLVRLKRESGIWRVQDFE